MTKKKDKFFKYGILETRKIGAQKATLTKVGSLKYALWGPEPSKQSKAIKMGKVVQEMYSFGITLNPKLTPQESGIQKVTGTKIKKDFDSVYSIIKTIVYREVKANIDLDTEKLSATIDKVKFLEQSLQLKFPGFKIDAGVLCPTVYSMDNIQNSHLHSKAMKIQNSGLSMDFAEDMFKKIELDISEEEWTAYLRKLGKIVLGGTDAEKI